MANCDHHFVFLRKESYELTSHTFTNFDIFYCTKCLEYKKVEIPPKQKF